MCVSVRALLLKLFADDAWARRYGLAVWDVLGRAKEFVRRDSLWTEKLSENFLRATALRWTGPGVFFLLVPGEQTVTGKLWNFTTLKMKRRAEYTSDPIDFMDSVEMPVLFFYRPHLEAFLDLPAMEAEQYLRSKAGAPVLQAYARRRFVRSMMRVQLFRVERGEKTRLASGETRVAHHAPAELFYQKMRKVLYGPKRAPASSVTPALYRVHPQTGKYVVARECDALVHAYENRGPEPWESLVPAL